MSSGIVDIITEIAKRQSHAAMLVDVMDGVVLTPAPDITISLGGTQIVLDADQLMISEHLLAHEIDATSDLATLEYRTSASGSFQPIEIRGAIQQTRELQTGETVAMIRFASGQKYFVFARGVSYGTDI